LTVIAEAIPEDLGAKNVTPKPTPQKMLRQVMSENEMEQRIRAARAMKVKTDPRLSALP
jgi:hypothetical protein